MCGIWCDLCSPPTVCVGGFLELSCPVDCLNICEKYWWSKIFLGGDVLLLYICIVILIAIMDR